MKKILALTLCLTIFALEAVYADNTVPMPKFAIPTARSAGMGGTHVAYTDNVFSLLVNPAAMMRVEQKSFFALSPALLNPQSFPSVVDMISSLLNDGGSDMMKSLGSVADILNRKNGKIALGFELREFPLSIAWVADGFGFGLWNRIYVNPNIKGINIELNLFVDVIMPVGFAFKILDIDSHSVDAGFTVKPFARAMSTTPKMKITDLLDKEKADAILKDDVRAPLIVGTGLDLGIIYRWDMGFSVGLTFNDIVSRGFKVRDLTEASEPNSSYYVPFSMSLGVAYDLKIGTFWTAAPKFLAKTGITFAFDWRDVANTFQQDDYTRRNALLDLGLGLQLSVANVFNLRLGMSEMLPACGIGVDLGAFSLDLAYYGRELGNEPGQLPAACVDLCLAIRLGAKKRDWPWTRGSLVGLFSKAGSAKVSA